MKNVVFPRCIILSILVLLFSINLSAQISWTPVNNGLTGVAVNNVKEIAVNSSEQLFAVTLGQGVFVSTNFGASWVSKNNGLTDLSVWCIAINSAGTIFIGTHSDGIFKSTDNGEHWTKLELGLSYFNAVRKIFICSNGYLFTNIEFTGFYRSTDNGNSWEVKINGLLNGGSVHSIYQDLAGQMLVGTSFGKIFFSNSYGEGWTESSSGLPVTTTAPVLCLIENEDEKYFAGTGEGLYRSTDYGHNWNQVHNGGGNGWVHSITLDNSDNVYIGTGYSGIYRSTDNGENWTQINNGLTHLGVYSMVVNTSGTIFVVTGDGIFKSSPTTNVKEKVELELTFVLDQNYPNPFNPSTRISYQVPTAGNVSLIIYNNLGEEIKSLINVYQSAGSYEVEFTADKLSSGIYFYQLSSGDLKITKKMVLMR